MNERPESLADIAILAKAPQPGYAKTRLIPALGASGAARLQRQLCLHALHTAHVAAIGQVTLWSAPDNRHRFFRALSRQHGMPIERQPEGDLGQRMTHIAGRHFACHPERPLLMIGTDCPVLTPSHLHAAATCLNAESAQDVVFVPAEDGGYVLVGLRRPVPDVFDEIAWSTEQVMAQTRRNLRAQAARWTELPPLWDIDRIEDLSRWQAMRIDLCNVGRPR